MNSIFSQEYKVKPAVWSKTSLVWLNKDVCALFIEGSSHIAADIEDWPEFLPPVLSVENAQRNFQTLGRRAFIYAN